MELLYRSWDIQLIEHNKYSFLVFDQSNCSDAIVENKLITLMPLFGLIGIKLAKNSANGIKFRLLDGSKI